MGVLCMSDDGLEVLGGQEIDYALCVCVWGQRELDNRQ